MTDCHFLHTQRFWQVCASPSLCCTVSFTAAFSAFMLLVGWQKARSAAAIFGSWSNCRIHVVDQLSLVKLRIVELLIELHLRPMWCHIPYGITQCYLPPDTCEQTPLNSSQMGRYSIYLSQRDGRLSWPRWLVSYWDDLPASHQCCDQ